MSNEFPAQPAEPQEDAAPGQEVTDEQVAPQSAEQPTDGGDHPELSAKVKEKNARTQARGQLQGGG